MSYRSLNQDRTRWQIDIYPDGRKGARKRVNIYGNEQEAIEFETALKREFGLEVPQHPLIKQAIPDWLEYCQNNLAEETYKDINKVLKKLLPNFGTVRFAALNSSHVEKYKTKRRENGVKDRTINKELSYLSSLLSWVTEPENKFFVPGFKFHVKLIPKVESPKPIILSLEEVQAIVDNMEPNYLCILLLYYDIGMRRTSALQIKAEDVDLANNCFQALGKGGKYRTFNITTNRLRTALACMLEQVETGYLFANPKTGKPYCSIRKAIKRAADKAGIKKRVYAHLLRHSFCTHGAKIGIPLRTLQHQLQHSTVKVTEKYANLDAEMHMDEMKKFQAVTERERGPMVRTFGSLRYNSAKATLIAERTNGLQLLSASYCFEQLYRTEKGNWFVVGEGGPATRYAKDSDTFGRDLVPLSQDEAQMWLERHNLIDQLEAHFGSEIEDA